MTRYKLCTKSELYRVLFPNTGQNLKLTTATKLTRTLMLLIRIREVHGSNLCRDLDYI